MKSLLLTLLAIVGWVAVQAQTYEEKADQIKKLIWDNPAPEFNVTVVPQEYGKESAVILAHSFAMERTSKGRVKFLIITGGMVRRTVKTATVHERVKINDKVALEQYSSVAYQKKLDKSVSLLVTKMANNNETFVGAKIIKPDGKVVMVNTSEEVLTKNTNKDQRGKLAIPDLQVGDILDYYISTYELLETGGAETYADNDHVYMLAEEYPVLYYSMDFTFGKGTSVKYILANGAPEMKTSVNADGDQTYSLKILNMPKYQTSVWTSPYRQYPYLEISSAYNTTMIAGYKVTDTKQSRLESNKQLFKSNYGQDYSVVYKEHKKMLKQYFDGKNYLKDIPQDSMLKVLYNIWKFRTFGRYRSTDLDDVSSINYRTATSKFNSMAISQLLSDMDIDHRILLVSSRNTSTLDNVYNYNDFDAMIMVNPLKPVYMCFNDVVCHFNEIPAAYQGEKALVIIPKNVKLDNGSAASQEMILPVSAAHENVEDQLINVSLQGDNMQQLKLERKVKQTGFLRHVMQRRLLSADAVDKGYMQLAKGDDLPKRLAESPDTKKKVQAFQEEFAKSASNSKEAFTAEIKDVYDQDPQQVIDYKIINPALEQSNPQFAYASTFVLENLVKKAGPNYIVEVGKLTGTFMKLEEKDRKRTIDVYMPSARTYKYVINVNIPAGYQVKGIAELNQQKTNKTGVFTSSAAVNGNTLAITVNKTYNNNFEKAADWPLVAELLDAGSNFNNAKVLFEKQN
jgi:hypothetical protein